MHAQPVGMLPAISGISDTEEYRDNETIQQFAHAEEVIDSQLPGGTAIGFEHGPSVQAGILTNQHVIEEMFQDIITGILTNQHVIEEMFQDIITNGTDVETAAKAAEDQLNDLFEAAQQ